ncbi:GMC family oxidoreductase [Stigmatella sp. ncwal1]|uniref:Cholesterol oxidase n=1 Tax=Stigmatella ashevillensis TaxID=2995309 RepID=A0ABT5D8G3_9BACT|nr:GMC family oxidoreductase [Stigmatella ashevillena]MDC0709962.1 GMC family oxidoreductase [Stigmatella ashevillena]
MKQGREHFDAIIVGSGFGGSVMAWRLAEAGLRVCVLERGKAYPPGSFPRSPYGMRRNFWDPSEGLQGLFNLWSFRGLGGVVASGLGGGSLIYANVLLRKDEKTFVHENLRDGGYEDWPVSRADLEPHYDAVEKMLGAQRYPFQDEPYRHTAKTIAMKLAAERMGLQDDWQLPPLAVTFANPGQKPVPGEPIQERHPNLHGRTRLTCRLCGECDIGCNYGSKNTLDYTYLSAAKRLGAELRVRCEVKSFWREGSEYVVEYLDHSEAREGERPEVPTSMLPRTVISADKLVLAAGTFGTTYLLLKNQQAFPGLSPRLGTRFCGNGDLLGFLSKCTDQSQGRREPRVLDGGHGPVITSALHIRDAAEGGTGRGYYVEDAGYPEFVNWLYEGSDQFALLKRFARLGQRIVKGWLGLSRDTDVSAEIAEVLGDCVGSASSLPLLAMGRDLPSGRMSLNRDGLLEVDWRMRDSAPYFRRVRQTMAQIADVLEGSLIQNPLSYLSRVITVHPLGGCPMGRTRMEGVVDSHGEVFNHPGLYVADGAVMPGPTGPNPSLTIAAFADRFADHLIEHFHRPPLSSPTQEAPWAHPPM